MAAVLTPEALAGLEPAERRTRLAGYLRERAAAALGVPAAAVALDQPLTALGLDSLSAIELKGRSRARSAWRCRWPTCSRGPRPATCAASACRSRRRRRLPPLRALDRAGDAPLSPGQRASGSSTGWRRRAGPTTSPWRRAPAGSTRRRSPRALEALAVRHEALRTIFPMVGDEPVQRVLRGAGAGRPSERSRRESELARRLAAEAWRPFDLEPGPLLRARVFQRPDGETTLLLAVHHIVADFGSLAVMARELAALYRGEALAPLPLRYADFVRWQAEALAGARGRAALGLLARSSSAGVRDLDLPADRPRPPVQTWRGDARARRSRRRSPPACGGWPPAGGATLFVALLAGLPGAARPLLRPGGLRRRLAVAGRAAAGAGGGRRLLRQPAGAARRPRRRRRVSASCSTGRGGRRSRRWSTATSRSPSSPSGCGRCAIRPGRRSSRRCSSSSGARPGDPAGLAAFALGEAGARARAGRPRAGVGAPAGAAGAARPHPLRGRGRRGGLGRSLEFNADLFDGGTAERMLGHLQTLLAGAAGGARDPGLAPAAARPGRAPAGCSTSGTRRAAAPRPRRGLRQLLLHQLFEAQAARPPAAVALVLRRRAADLRRAGRRAPTAWPIACGALGVRPGDRVGLCLERSARAGRRPARRAQGGRRLRAARSRLSGRAAGADPGGRRRRGRPRRGDRRGAACANGVPLASLDRRTMPRGGGDRRRAPPIRSVAPPTSPT